MKYIPMLTVRLIGECIITIISWLEYLLWWSQQPVVFKDCGGYKITACVRKPNVYAGINREHTGTYGAKIYGGEK